MPEPVSRRTALTAGLVLVTAACTVDPRIETPTSTSSARPTATSGPAAPTGAPAPTPGFDGSAEGVALEVRLAATATSVASKWRSDLGDRRGLLTGLRAAHLAHATALASTDPTARPTSGGPSLPPRRPGQSELDDALEDLAEAEQAAAADHRERALAATGFAALLWASMGAAATAYGQAVAGLADLDDDEDPADVETGLERRPLPTVSDTAALQDLVRQLHAAVYGYQLALGQLTGDAREQAVDRLRAHRQLRDSLIRQLITRSVEVPDAAPAYVPSPAPTTAARARRLLRGMERALLPFTGLWLASAATSADRASAYAALLATDAAARRWGADLLVWPGWNG